MSVGSRRSMRKRSQARRKREKIKDLAHALTRGVQWSVLFFGLLVSLVGVLVAILAGEIVYTVLFFVFSLFVGATLWSRETT